jgi:hypothetical protein
MEVAMINSPFFKSLVRPMSSAWFPASKWTVGHNIRGLIVVLLSLTSPCATSQQTHVLLSADRALVTQINVSLGETYALTKDHEGDVWTAIDPLVLMTKKDGKQTTKRVLAGEAAIVGSGEELQFHVDGDSHARLVIVKPKTAHQELTVGPFILSSTIEDASDRNATLLVAVSDCRFRDTRNLGDESEWIPSKPDIIMMKAGSVRWIRPGIHHFKNLGPMAAKLVSIEW